MRYYSLLISLFCIPMLLACSQWLETSNIAKPTPLKPIASVLPLKIKWSTTIGNKIPDGFVPVYDRGNIVAADKVGNLYILDALTGRVRTQFALKRQLTSAVAIAEDKALLGTREGTLLAVNLLSGQTLWERTLTSIALEPAAVGNQLAIVKTNDGRLTGFSPKDGTQLWSVNYLQPQLIVRDTGSMRIVGDEVVLVGLPAGKFAVIDQKTGNLLWEANVAYPKGATELERVTDVVSRPVFDNKQVCAVAYQGRLACFDTQSGNLQWARDVPSSRGLALDKNVVYVSGEDSVVSAFDRTSGRLLWAQEELKYRDISAPTILGDNVLVVDNEGYAHLLSREDGRFLSRLRLGDQGSTGQPVPFDDALMVQTRDGRLTMLSLG